MWPAQLRTLHAIPPRSLADAPPGVFRCFSHDCAGCEAFEPRRSAFEQRFRGDAIVPWDCDVARRRDFALAAGATKLPCYVNTRTGEVIYPETRS